MMGDPLPVAPIRRVVDEEGFAYVPDADDSVEVAALAQYSVAAELAATTASLYHVAVANVAGPTVFGVTPLRIRKARPSGSNDKSELKVPRIPQIPLFAAVAVMYIQHVIVKGIAGGSDVDAYPVSLGPHRTAISGVRVGDIEHG
jgi:hypothetical protein